MKKSLSCCCSDCQYLERLLEVIRSPSESLAILLNLDILYIGTRIASGISDGTCSYYFASTVL